MGQVGASLVNPQGWGNWFVPLNPTLSTPTESPSPTDARLEDDHPVNLDAMDTSVPVSSPCSPTVVGPGQWGHPESF